MFSSANRQLARTGFWKKNNNVGEDVGIAAHPYSTNTHTQNDAQDKHTHARVRAHTHTHTASHLSHPMLSLHSDGLEIGFNVPPPLNSLTYKTHICRV